VLCGRAFAGRDRSPPNKNDGHGHFTDVSDRCTSGAKTSTAHTLTGVHDEMLILRGPVIPRRALLSQSRRKKSNRRSVD